MRNWNNDPCYLAMRDSQAARDRASGKPLISLKVHALIWAAGATFGVIGYLLTN